LRLRAATIAKRGVHEPWEHLAALPVVMRSLTPPDQGTIHMAKAKKAKQTRTRARAGTKSSSKRTTGKPARRASSRSTGIMSGLTDFIPANLMQNVLGSQTSRMIMAEALVAAAGAAAAVLVASRTEAGQRAGKAMADSGALMKEA